MGCYSELILAPTSIAFQSCWILVGVTRPQAAQEYAEGSSPYPWVQARIKANRLHLT